MFLFVKNLRHLTNKINSNNVGRKLAEPSFIDER